MLESRHLRLLQELLAKHVPGAEVRAFGSRVKGNAHEGSDLDLLLCNPAVPGQPVPGLPGLVNALQASALPMLVDVHDACRMPPAFLEEINQCSVLLQPRSPSDRTP
jgi:predicted nucleotidyltransferase